MKQWILYAAGAVMFIIVMIVWMGAERRPDRSPQGTLGSEPVAPGQHDLTRNGTTTRQYYRSTQAQKQAFCDYFTVAWFGHADELAADELAMQLERLRGLPATTDHTSMMLAATGKTPLWEAAMGAADNLGWPRKG